MKKHLTKQQFYSMYVRPYVYQDDGSIDKPANRMLWSHCLDSAFQSGDISQRQVNNWIYPSNKFFL